MASVQRRENSAETDLDFAMRPVPPEERCSRGAMMMASWAISSGVIFFVIAAALAQGFGAKNAIIGLVLSVITFSIVNAALTRYAIRTGTSVSLLSGDLFGKKGASLATLIFFLTAIYYGVFESSVIAVGISETFKEISYPLAALIVVVYSIILMLGTIQNWLSKINTVLFPLFIIGLLAAVVMAIGEYGYSNAWLSVGPEGGAPAYGWWDCFVAYMGVWIILMYAFDFARFGREEDSGFHIYFTFGLPFYGLTLLVNGLVGIFLVGTVPLEGGLSEVSVLIALLKLMGVAGLLFVWVTQTRINTANFQMAIVNMKGFAAQVFNLRMPKFVWAIIVGGAVFLLMLADVFSFLFAALAYQGIFVVAWVAIAVSHIVGGREQRLVHNDSEWSDVALPDFNAAGLVAWFVSVIIGTCIYLFGANFASFSAPATAIIAASLYLGLQQVAQARNKTSLVKDTASVQ